MPGDPDGNLPWWRHDRPWGFRFSGFDAAVIIIGCIATAIAARYFPLLAILIPLTLGHFLLFCNTFRIGGERSLIWIAALLVNIWAWLLFGEFSWTKVVLGQIALAVVLIGQTALSRNYHGVACQWINPHGFKQGAKAEGAFTRRTLKRVGLSPRAIDVLTGSKPVPHGQSNVTLP